ncbi:hypothetical protein [Sphingobium sp. CFD-2]|uniref:hypothetical protein n=1 Tax=Sphingobium sp. CFD-2 TaxID=2878542 RepID=UPI00214AB696|nr:hypothetical protein [Sphingobium sp. CFD-2]
MKGYIYITSTGADPAFKNNLNDPIFGDDPSLGACMPNIRRFVEKGDYIFVVSGSTVGVQQYIIGGMQVAEKIPMIEAYKRFPKNRLRLGNDGLVKGNIIIDEFGKQHNLDTHAPETFENRVKNFIVGSNAVSLESKREVEIGRSQSLNKLGDVFGKRGNRPIDIFGRWSKLNDGQVKDVVGWLEGVKRAAAA